MPKLDQLGQCSAGTSWLNATPLYKEFQEPKFTAARFFNNLLRKSAIGRQPLNSKIVSHKSLNKIDG